ncbi:PhnA-like protein [Rhizobium laguerreae]|uniref:PhnA-like protein n=1 Tax=Rhizobium laguerreae TaxID=1076926 RepID=UPI001C925F00|nr:PhnA-like protein [Rhizobium laguerreae]MBY3101906.1 PhnA-like protein [Rhizobium laguerreae]MBY3243180.1 PhnA-like protein [Rhizobium laguerreae]MBY3530828.1 PhnA-like protein [Rhizobium laguerreae]
MTEPVSSVAHIHTRDDNPYLNAAFNKISWGAVFAGVAVALVVQLLLNLLGAGIGAAVIDPASDDNPSATTLSVSTAIWFVVSGVIASFIGGYVSSRLSGRPVRSTGALHGVTSWAVTTLIVIYLLTSSVGVLVGGVFNGLGGIVSSAGSTVASAATTAAPALATATDPMAGIEQNIRDLSGGNDPAALRDAAVASMRAALTGDQAKAEEARNRAADALAKAQNIPADQARQQVTQYEQQYQDAVAQAKQQATEAAQAAATAFSAGAILAFIALAVGAIAAWMGGAVGTTHIAGDEDVYVAH